MNYVLDTNILVHFVRKTALKYAIEERFPLSDHRNTILVSVVSVGELKSLSIQNKWGEKRLEIIEEILGQYLIADIHSDDVIERYAEIDAFSQGLLPGKTLEMSARNMGKNDLWIAATSSVLNATLITTDADFDHLNKTFLKLERIFSK